MPKRFEVEVPDGQHLGYSRGTDGARRAHLFRDDTNQLVGHAELFEVVEDELRAPDWRPDQFAASADEAPRRCAEPHPVAEALADAIVGWLSPHVDAAAARAGDAVRNWVIQTVVPALKSAARSARSKATGRGQGHHRAASPDVVTVGPLVTARSHEQAVVAVPADGPAVINDAARARHIAELLEANPALLDEFLKVFPGAEAANALATEALPMEDARPSLRLVAG